MENIIAQIAKYFKFEHESAYFLFETNLKRYFTAILMVLLVLSGFFMGKISKVLENKPGFKIENMTESRTTSIDKQNSLKVMEKATVVASKGGKKYYFLWCKGSDNIKEKNKRYFDTEEEAQNAGYVLAGNCK